MGRTKLSEADVAGIRHAYTAEGMSLYDLSIIYGVSRTQIWRIVNRRQRLASIKGSLPLRSIDPAPQKSYPISEIDFLKWVNHLISRGNH